MQNVQLISVLIHSDRDCPSASSALQKLSELGHAYHTAIINALSSADVHASYRYADTGASTHSLQRVDA